MALEDPFDNLGLDGIYIDEAVFDIEQARMRQRLWQCTVSTPHPSLHWMHSRPHFHGHTSTSTVQQGAL